MQVLCPLSPMQEAPPYFREHVSLLSSAATGRPCPAPRAVAPVTGPYARARPFSSWAPRTSACGGSVSGEPVPVPFYGPAVIDASTDQDSGEPLPVVF